MEDKRRVLYKAEPIHNFRELVQRYQNLYADKLAFEYKLEPKSKDYIKITYGQFVADIKAFGTKLLQMGLRQKRVAIIAPNRYEWCVSYLAVTTSDIIVVPLDKSLPANELESLIKRSEAEAVIFDKEYIPTFEKLQAEKSSHLSHFICMDTPPSETNFLCYSNLIEEGKKLLLVTSTYSCNIYDTIYRRICFCCYLPFLFTMHTYYYFYS